MSRRMPSLPSLCLAALLAAVLGLGWLTAWVMSWQGLKVEALAEPGGPVRYAAQWHSPSFSSTEPAPLDGRKPRHLRLTGYFHPPAPGTWLAALVSQAEEAISLGGTEWRVPGLAVEPVPDWLIRADPGYGAELALDRDPATRFSSGVFQRGGESLTLDLGSAREVLGVILDAQTSVEDGPAGLAVEISGDGKLYSPAGAVASFPPGLPMAEVFFPALQARWLRLTQTGERPRFFWSAHEIYVVDGEMLERRARAIDLAAAPQPLSLTLAADPAHPAAELGYLLGRVFVRPPGGSWRALPTHRLSITPQAGPPWLAWLALVMEPWLTPAALICLALLMASLYRDWLWPEE